MPEKNHSDNDFVFLFCFRVCNKYRVLGYKSANKWPYNKNILLSILQKIATNKDI